MLCDDGRDAKKIRVNDREETFREEALGKTWQQR
jgi:hypothetical protein